MVWPQWVATRHALRISCAAKASSAAQTSANLPERAKRLLSWSLLRRIKRTLPVQFLHAAVLKAVSQNSSWLLANAAADSRCGKGSEQCKRRIANSWKKRLKGKTGDSNPCSAKGCMHGGGVGLLRAGWRCESGRRPSLQSQSSLLHQLGSPGSRGFRAAVQCRGRICAAA